MKTGAQLIAEERQRQIDAEGWTASHDDGHEKFELTLAAVSYAHTVASPDEWAAAHHALPAPTDDWPWPLRDWKPSRDPVRNLVKAGALIAAEIDRLLRLSSR